MTIILLVGLLVALIVTGSFAIPFARRRAQQFRTHIELEAIGTYMRLEQECPTTIQTNEHLGRARKRLMAMSFQYCHHPDELGLPGLQYFGNLRRESSSTSANVPGFCSTNIREEKFRTG